MLVFLVCFIVVIVVMIATFVYRRTEGSRHALQNSALLAQFCKGAVL